MSDTQTIKKRGRPALLLNNAELQAYVEYVKETKLIDELNAKSVSIVEAANFNLEQISITDLVILKQAMKPFREYQRVLLMYQILSKELMTFHPFEDKFCEIFQEYQKTPDDQSLLNILKTMATRYIRFEKSDYKDSISLNLYLDHLEKKQRKKKRNEENHRKFQLGGAVEAAFKQLNIDVQEKTPETIKNIIVNHANLHKKIMELKAYKQVKNHNDDYHKRINLLIDVIEGLSTYSLNSGKNLVEAEIEKHKGKYK